MPSNLKKRNRTLLDSVVDEVEQRRILRYRLYAGQQILRAEKAGSIRTHVFPNEQFYDKGIQNLVSELGNDTSPTDFSPKRRILSRSLSDPTGTLNTLHLHETFENSTTHLKSSQDMTKLLETAGQLTWLHFLSESVRTHSKHRGSEPACSVSSMRGRNSRARERKAVFSKTPPLYKRDGHQKKTPGQCKENYQTKAIQFDANRVLAAKRSKFVLKTGKAYFSIPNTANQNNREVNQNTKAIPKKSSLGIVMSFNSSLPPIHEARSVTGNGTSNTSLSESVIALDIQSTSSNVILERSPSLPSVQEKDKDQTPQLKPNLYHQSKGLKSADKKVFFDITSESSEEVQSISEDNAGVPSLSVARNKKFKRVKAQKEKENGTRVNSISPGDASSLSQNHVHGLSTNTRFRKLGKVENKIEKRRRNPLPSLPAHRKMDPTRRFSLVTQTGVRSSSSESDLSSLDEADSVVKSGPISFQRRQLSQFDKKFSNASMQVIGDTSRPSITNPSETFERHSGSKELPDVDDCPPPPLPERMVSFLSKINAWRASGPDVPRPRARTSGSLPSIMK